MSANQTTTSQIPMQQNQQSVNPQNIWYGLLEWKEKPKNDPQKITKQVPCHVSINPPKDGELGLKVDGWPPKLLMQLLPKQLISNIGGVDLKNSKSVMFHPQSCEALESLTKALSSGFAGCVRFPSPTNNASCEIKVLILYLTETRAYLGFIPNDQIAFVDRFCKVMQQQKDIQMPQSVKPLYMSPHQVCTTQNNSSTSQQMQPPLSILSAAEVNSINRILQSIQSAHKAKIQTSVPQNTENNVQQLPSASQVMVVKQTVGSHAQVAIKENQQLADPQNMGTSQSSRTTVVRDTLTISASRKRRPNLTDQYAPVRIRKRISGAEARRRRKAREALTAIATASDMANPVPSSHNQTRAPCSKENVQPEQKSPEMHLKETDTPTSRKRVGSSSSCASPAQPKKKVALSQKLSTSCNGVLPNHLRVAVIDIENSLGKLTQSRVDLVKRELCQQLDDCLCAADGSTFQPPTFLSWAYVGEILRITCKDEASVEWLRNAIKRCRPWEGSKLDVVLLHQLPKLTKATLWVPRDKCVPGDKERVLNRLAAQNPTISVRKWCLFHHTEKDSGQLFVFGVGQADIRTLKESEERVNYMFQTLTLKLKQAVSETSGEEVEIKDDAAPDNWDAEGVLLEEIATIPPTQAAEAFVDLQELFSPP